MSYLSTSPFNLLGIKLILGCGLAGDICEQLHCIIIMVLLSSTRQQFCGEMNAVCGCKKRGGTCSRGGSRTFLIVGLNARVGKSTGNHTY